MNRTVQRILSEDAISLAEAQKELTPILGKRPDKSTLVRWCNRGVGGVKLEHVRIGSQIIISRQSLTRFIEGRTEAAV